MSPKITNKYASLSRQWSIDLLPALTFKYFYMYKIKKIKYVCMVLLNKFAYMCTEYD